MKVPWGERVRRAFLPSAPPELQVASSIHSSLKLQVNRLVHPMLPPQTRQTKLDFHQEQAAEKMLKKASKGVCQLRGQSHKEPVQVQTFR